MKIFSVLRWLLRIILLILLIVLVIDNIQTVKFNLFGIYSLQLPLIAIALIFLGLGILFGLVVSFIRTLELKAKINKLQKQIDKPIE